MKAIILNDDDCTELVEKLELLKLRKTEFDEVNKLVITDAHRAFHYEVMSWLQKHGYKA